MSDEWDKSQPTGKCCHLPTKALAFGREVFGGARTLVEPSEDCLYTTQSSADV